MINFKALFRFKEESPQRLLAAIVYRALMGKIEILLWQDKDQNWRLPDGLRADDQSTVDVIKQIPILYTLDDARPGSLKFWQSLGRVSYRQAKMSVEVDLFLVQLLGDSVSIQANRQIQDFRWFTATQAINQLQQPELKESLALAISKIKRAQV